MELFEQLKNEQKNWIRFELGLDALDDKAYYKEVYHRAHAIMKEMFDEDDTILLVAVIHTHVDDKQHHLPRIKRFLKDKKLIYGLTHKTTAFTYDREDLEMKTNLYSLRMKKEDLYVDDMLKNPTMNSDLYIVNETRKTLFYMYDTRGCDVYSLEKSDLRPLYHTFRKWILDYHRIDIDYHFEEGLVNYFETSAERKRREQANEQQVEATNINLFERNTCHITHQLEIPKENAEACIAEISQTGFKIEAKKELGEVILLKATKTEALAIINYQTELMSLYVKKYSGVYKGWSIVKDF